jgi:hypothetical protein
MRWQTTVVLAVILLALGGFYYVYEVRMAPEREKVAGRKDRVWMVEPADVVEVRLKRADEVVRLKREGEGWQMQEPVTARADRGAVNDALTTIVTAKADREIAAAPESLAEFGLDKPAAEITATLKDGKQLGLLLGSKSPTGVWVYARDRDKPAVVVVPEGVLRDATRPVAEFRDKTVLDVDRGAVTGFEIVTRDDTIAVEQADRAWKLTRPVALPADTDTVSDLFEKLTTAKVKTFVAEAPRSLQPYGLERPVRLSIHTGKDKDRATRSLLFGRVDPGKGVFAMRPGEASVLLLPEEVWTALPKTVAAIRDKVVLDFDRDKLSRLELDSPKGKVTLVREAGRWRMTAPEPLPADPVEVGAVLARLRELRAQGFLADDASAIPRYLGRPEVRVALTAEGAGEPTTVLLAPSPERRGGRPSAYAAVAGRGPVVLVDAKALGELAKSVTDLRDRTLLGGLEPKDVKRLQARAGGKSVVVERAGESDWKTIEPTPGSARSAKVEDLLYALRGLRWREIVAPGGEDAAKYGLDAPALEVTLNRADGTEIATVMIGKREADRAWVRLKAAPTIYAVDARQLGELPKGPEDLAQ